MGHYTRFTFFAEIDDEAAEVIQSVLDDQEEPEYRWMNRPVNHSSYSFHTQGSVLERDPQNFWRLCIDTSCKNYEQEIQRFLDWILPHVCDNTWDHFSGFYQYEDSMTPVLIYRTADGWVFDHPNLPEGIDV